ncbi:MAG: TIGR04086 family membrane protein [Eubacteriales bacterium]
MNVTKKKVDGVTMMIKSLLGAYAMTMVALMVLAFCLYRFRLGEAVVAMAIIGIYILITFVSGYIIGRKIGSRKFLWGMLSGLCYFLVLLLISAIVNHGFPEMGNQGVTTFMLCVASGTLGGMLA